MALLLGTRSFSCQGTEGEPSLFSKEKCLSLQRDILLYEAKTGKEAALLPPVETWGYPRRRLMNGSEHTTERRDHEETMLRHAWFNPSASGRLNQKVEPSPGALWTPTCPWCCSIMTLAMAKPRPNPLPGPWC